MPTDFQVNEVELKIPRYAISNTSDHFYVRFFKKRAIGDHIYAESAPFAVVNSEQSMIINANVI